MKLVDDHGVEHSVRVRAESVYEAALKGLLQKLERIGFFLNGLPIVALELKHEKNQTVHDAVAQFAARDHARKIYQHPFLYLAADTSDVMAGTDPCREQNFRLRRVR